jgi:hypothetical protein
MERTGGEKETQNRQIAWVSPTILHQYTHTTTAFLYCIICWVALRVLRYHHPIMKQKE